MTGMDRTQMLLTQMLFKLLGDGELTLRDRREIAQHLEALETELTKLRYVADVVQKLGQSIDQ